MTFALRMLLCIISITSFIAKAQAYGLHPYVKNNLKELAKLDSIIERQPELSMRKEAKLKSLTETLASASEAPTRLYLSNKLFEEYRYYDSDSALKYSRMTYDIARQLIPRNDSLLTNSLIDQAYMHSIQGYHAKASEMLDMIHSENLKNQQILLKYYKAKEYGASMELVYATDNKEKTDHIWKELLQYRDSLKSLSKDHPEIYPWIYVAEKLEGEGDVSSLSPDKLNRLKAAVDTVAETARIDAPSAYWLARYYSAVGDTTAMLHYLIKASQIKILNQTRENPALPELAELLYRYGDIDRAFNYIMYSGNQINAYKNRNRIVMTNSIISRIKDAYNARLKQHDRRLQICVGGLIVFAILLVAFTFALINRNKKLHLTQRQLSEANTGLKEALAQRGEAIESLKAANEDLARLTKMKHEVIALAFHLAATQISHLDDFRKKLLRKYKANQIPQMATQLNSDDIIKEYYNELNTAFDKTIITTFPEFIDDYDDSLGEGSKLDKDAIIKSQTLSVRLRIYALRRLGIEKSADLAKILNLSIRTVYNIRSTEAKKS